MKDTTVEKGVLDILKEGGVWGSKEMAESLSIEIPKLRDAVRKIRRRFLDGEEVPYIFTAKGGYTVDEKPENVMYEARMRLAFGTGVLLNGVHVFRRGKRIAAKNFSVLRVEYKPRMDELSEIIK